MSGYTYDLYEQGNLEGKLSIEVAEPAQGQVLYLKNGETQYNVYAYKGVAPGDVNTFRFELIRSIDADKPSQDWDTAIAKVPKHMRHTSESIGIIVEPYSKFTAWKRTQAYTTITQQHANREATNAELALWQALSTYLQGGA